MLFHLPSFGRGGARGSHEPVQEYHQDLNESPTTTPFHTRSTTPSQDVPRPHTAVDSRATVAGLLSVLGERHAHAEVGVVDGSAIVPAAIKLKYLGIYFALNLGLTFFNKIIMSKLPFPILLTALHAASSFLGSRILLSKGYFSISHMSRNAELVLSLFSLLYTANIAMSNISLHLVTLPFHQITRAATPVFTIIIYRYGYDCVYPQDVYLSLVPLIMGVLLSTYGDFYVTFSGICVTFIGVVLAALKTVATNRLQTAGVRVHALELLYWMSPFALLQAMIASYLNGEVEGFVNYMLYTDAFTFKTLFILLLNGAMAFSLNFISFSANKQVGALTMTVAANIKQIIAVFIGLVVWNIRVGWMNAVGICLTLVGGAMYGYVSIPGKDTEFADPEKGRQTQN